MNDYGNPNLTSILESFNKNAALTNSSQMSRIGDGDTTGVQTNGFDFGNAFGQNGWGMTALQSIMGLGSLLNANKALKMQDRSMNTSIDALKTNLFNQSQTVNSNMYSRQKARNAINPDLHENADAYMKRWGVSGTLGSTDVASNAVAPEQAKPVDESAPRNNMRSVGRRG